MRPVSKSVMLILFTGVFSTMLTMGQSPLESGIKIPVYPGATLVTEREPGESASCCNFASKDNFEKVIAFYESTLKIKSLDINGLATQLPFLKPQTDMMLKEMPAGMKFRVFVLKVVEFQGQKGAELFEVYTSPKGVEFSITESQLRPDDQHYTSDFERVVSGAPEQTNPQSLVGALPTQGPAGYTKGETDTEQTPGMPATVSTFFTKLVKKGTGGGESGTEDIYSHINVTITEGDKEFLEEMIKPQGDNVKTVTVKGKYKGVEGIDRNDSGCVGAYVAFVVYNKFLVEITESYYCDPKIIYQVIDKMNPEILPR